MQRIVATYMQQSVAAAALRPKGQPVGCTGYFCIYFWSLRHSVVRSMPSSRAARVPGASGVRPKASQRKGKKHHRNSVSVRIFQSEPSHQGFFRPIRDLPKAIPDCQAARAPCRSRFMRRAAYMSPPCRFLTYHTPYIGSSSAFPLAKPPSPSRCSAQAGFPEGLCMVHSMLL